MTVVPVGVSDQVRAVPISIAVAMGPVIEEAQAPPVPRPVAVAVDEVPVLLYAGGVHVAVAEASVVVEAGDMRGLVA